MQRIDLTRFFLMLSDALELAAPGMALHQTRTAYIALRIAQSLGMSRQRMLDLVHAALLHDIGALSPEEKIELHSANPRLIASHCRNGAIVLSRVSILERAARLVFVHHDHWKTSRAVTADEAFDANIIALADTAELATERSTYILLQRQHIESKITAGSGTQFCPEIADAFRSAARSEEFWLELASPRLSADFMDDQSVMEHYITLQDFAPVSALVRDIIDFRSTFTATHSSGVAAAAMMIGALIGYSETENLSLMIAGNLHDIGKMAIPNAILLKPTTLDGTEDAIMRQHPFHTRSVLARAGLPATIVEWASCHHERLDGTGYPFAMHGTEISLGARIVSVADVLTALAEQRPYRPALPRPEVLSTLASEATNSHLEAGLIDLVAGSYGRIAAAMFDAQHSAEEFYSRKLEYS